MSRAPSHRVERRIARRIARWGGVGIGLTVLLAAPAAANPGGAVVVPQHAREGAGEGTRPGSAVVLVAGVGGTPEYRERFTGWVSELCLAARSAPRPPVVRVLVERLEDAAKEEGGDPGCTPAARSTREELGETLAATDAGLGPGEGLLLVLIGHGSGGPEPRFNLPGPDLAPTDLAGMLDPLGDRPVTVAHLGSASGAFVPALAAPGRVVLTASRAHETNETRFGRHFVAAFSGGEADRDKDGAITALEIFDFARIAVEREYEQEGLLLTEHALLDDNGDGVGSLAPEARPGSDGVLASRRRLLFTSREAAEIAATTADDPALRGLIAERDELAAQVDQLREVRGSMEEEAYLAELEALLLRIAEIAEQIEARRKPTEGSR